MGYSNYDINRSSTNNGRCNEKRKRKCYVPYDGTPLGGVNPFRSPYEPEPSAFGSSCIDDIDIPMTDPDDY